MNLQRNVFSLLLFYLQNSVCVYTHTQHGIWGKRNFYDDGWCYRFLMLCVVYCICILRKVFIKHITLYVLILNHKYYLTRHSPTDESQYWFRVCILIWPTRATLFSRAFTLDRSVHWLYQVTERDPFKNVSLDLILVLLKLFSGEGPKFTEPSLDSVPTSIWKPLSYSMLEVYK